MQTTRSHYLKLIQKTRYILVWHFQAICHKETIKNIRFWIKSFNNLVSKKKLSISLKKKDEITPLSWPHAAKPRSHLRESRSPKASISEFLWKIAQFCQFSSYLNFAFTVHIKWGAMRIIIEFLNYN